MLNSFSIFIADFFLFFSFNFSYSFPSIYSLCKKHFHFIFLLDFISNISFHRIFLHYVCWVLYVSVKIRIVLVLLHFISPVMNLFFHRNNTQKKTYSNRIHKNEPAISLSIRPVNIRINQTNHSNTQSHTHNMATFFLFYF